MRRFLLPFLVALVLPTGVSADEEQEKFAAAKIIGFVECKKEEAIRSGKYAPEVNRIMDEFQKHAFEKENLNPKLVNDKDVKLLIPVAIEMHDPDNECQLIEDDEVVKNKIEKKTKPTDNSSDANSEFNEGKDCLNGDLCIGEGKEKDRFGMLTLKDYLYIHYPEDNKVIYTSWHPKEVNVKGDYGRYLEFIQIVRKYQNPKSGTSGYSSTIGSGSANCFDSGYGISCTTSPPTTLNIPGRSATPGGDCSNKI